MAFTENEIMTMLKKGSVLLYNEDIVQLIDSKNNTINRQQAEIEKLNRIMGNDREIINEKCDELQNVKKELQSTCIAVKSYKGKYESAVETAKDLKTVIAEKQAEIERLREEKAKFDYTILYDLEQVEKIVEKTKSEAIKEVLDRFDIEYCKVFSTPEISFMKEFKRVFLKEMVGDDK